MIWQQVIESAGSQLFTWMSKISYFPYKTWRTLVGKTVLMWHRRCLPMWHCQQDPYFDLNSFVMANKMVSVLRYFVKESTMRFNASSFMFSGIVFLITTGRRRSTIFMQFRDKVLIIWRIFTQYFCDSMFSRKFLQIANFPDQFPNFWVVFTEFSSNISFLMHM